jgi:hypothetical protein
MACIVHFLPAKAGDCLVLELDNKDCILIDCGYAATYELELKPLLLRLQEKGCQVILLLVTHIDQDHIEGAIRLLDENGDSDNPRIIPIENVWFNGFFNTLFQRPEFARRRVANLTAAALQQRDVMLKELLMQVEGENGYISAEHSKCFEELCMQNGYCLNRQFTGAVVQQAGVNREKILSAGVSIGDCLLYVLGPGKKQLDGLTHKLDVDMIRSFGHDYQLDETFGKLFELLLEMHTEPSTAERKIAALGGRLESWLGTSALAPMNVVNRASIVVEIEYKGLRMLFAGDADSSDWVDGLGPHYQLIKLSHHGTAKPNLALLEKSRGDILLISTNGGQEGHHPEDELLARAILAGNRTLCFNYDINRKGQLLAMQKEYGYSVRFKEREIIL